VFNSHFFCRNEDYNQNMKPTQDPNMKFERMKASMCPFFGVGEGSRLSVSIDDNGTV
jgi:hypothetical protein